MYTSEARPCWSSLEHKLLWFLCIVLLVVLKIPTSQLENRERERERESSCLWLI